MRKILVDTSAWLGGVIGGDQHAEGARAFFTQLRAKGVELHSTDYIFDEAVTRANRIGGHRAAVALGETILESVAGELIEVDRSLREEAWRLFRKFDDQQLSFTDCTSIAAMTRYHISDVFSFDDDFRRVGVSTIPHKRK